MIEHKECEVCGISAVPHTHPPNTLPKDFVKTETLEADPKDEAKEWYEKEPYKCKHRNPYTGDVLNVHWDIPAIISQARTLERKETIEIIVESLQDMLKDLDTAGGLVGGNIYMNGAREAIQNILSKLQGLRGEEWNPEIKSECKMEEGCTSCE